MSENSLTEKEQDHLRTLLSDLRFRVRLNKHEASVTKNPDLAYTLQGSAEYDERHAKALYKALVQLGVRALGPEP